MSFQSHHLMTIYRPPTKIDPDQHDDHIRAYNWHLRVLANRIAVDSVHELVIKGAFK